MDNCNHNAQNVVHMAEYQPETGYTAIAQVEAYWQALRDGNAIPKRSEIDPRGIEQALEYAFILERIAPGIARLRIAGSKLNDVMGMEVRGMPLTALFHAPHRRDIADILEEVFQRPATASLRLVSEADAGRPDLRARMTLLPLRSDLGDISRILGCFVFQGDIGLAPRRFMITARNLHPVADPAMPWPVAPSPDYNVPVRSTGFAEPAAAFTHKKPAQPGGAPTGSNRKGRPYLRLVEKTKER